jgi:hypothetical protein
MITIAVEVLVAAAFRVGSDGLKAVALASCVTNPLMNALLTFSYIYAVGYKVTGPGTYYPQIYHIPSYAPSALWYAVFAAAEVLVVLVEWWLLVWVIGHRVSARRLLVLSVVMNAASASLSVWHRGTPLLALLTVPAVPLALLVGLIVLAMRLIRRKLAASRASS